MEINVIVIEKQDGTRLFKTKGAYFFTQKKHYENIGTNFGWRLPLLACCLR